MADAPGTKILNGVMDWWNAGPNNRGMSHGLRIHRPNAAGARMTTLSIKERFAHLQAPAWSQWEPLASVRPEIARGMINKPSLNDTAARYKPSVGPGRRKLIRN